jgi:peptidoglycan/xylan/chitin deacetylase (PgdA/CDA1 family)
MRNKQNIPDSHINTLADARIAAATNQPGGIAEYHASVFGRQTRRTRSSFPTPVYADLMGDISVWDDRLPVIEATRAANTTEFLTGIQSMKVTTGDVTQAGGGSAVECVPASPLDLSNTLPHLSYFVHETGASNINYGSITLYSGANYKQYKWFHTISTTANNTGWGMIGFGPSAETLTQSGTLDWSAITKILIRIDRTSPAVSSVSFDNLLCLPKMAVPKVAITFDDGYASAYPCAAYMAGKGLPAVFYVIPSLIGTNAAYLTWEQCRWMERLNMVIGNHTNDHETWDSQTVSQRAENVSAGIRALFENTSGAGARVLATPGGAWKGDEDEAAIMPLVEQVRLVGGQGGAGKTTLARPELMTCSLSVATTALAADINAAATVYEACKIDGAPCVLNFHGITGDAIAAFQTLIDTITTDHRAGTVNVVTIADMLAGW